MPAAGLTAKPQAVGPGAGPPPLEPPPLADEDDAVTGSVPSAAPARAAAASPVPAAAPAPAPVAPAPQAPALEAAPDPEEIARAIIDYLKKKPAGKGKPSCHPLKQPCHGCLSSHQPDKLL